MEPVPSELTERQKRELDYHVQHAAKHTTLASTRVPMDIVTSDTRRWWNPYWHTYTCLRALDLRHKRALVVGCGFGEDAIRVAMLAAEVCAFDLSPDLIAIARARAQVSGVQNIHFDVAPAEALPYPEDHFDLVVCVNILHHVDIPRAFREMQRVVKPGCAIVINEPYTHNAIQRLRTSAFVEKFLYPRMLKFIYGSTDPYLTEDERKLTETDVRDIVTFVSNPRQDFFNLFASRVVPDRKIFETIDRMIFRAAPGLGQYFGERLVMSGILQKPSPSTPDKQ